MISVANIHPIQEMILKKLGYNEEKAFSEIRGDIESNKLSFHLKKLQERDLIEKTDEGYKSTKKGREILPYFDLENSRHPVVVVDILVFSEDRVYLKQKEGDPLDPFSGDYRAPSTRVSKNNRIHRTAEKLFEEEFGKESNNVEIGAIFDSEVHFQDNSKQHYLLFFFVVEEDELNKEFTPLDELRELNILPGLDKVIKSVKERDSLFMGKWDVKQEEEGLKVKEFLKY